jgi:hypothetical protein
VQVWCVLLQPVENGAGEEPGGLHLVVLGLLPVTCRTEQELVAHAARGLREGDEYRSVLQLILLLECRAGIDEQDLLLEAGQGVTSQEHTQFLDAKTPPVGVACVRSEQKRAGAALAQGSVPAPVDVENPAGDAGQLIDEDFANVFGCGDATPGDVGGFGFGGNAGHAYVQGGEQQRNVLLRDTSLPQPARKAHRVGSSSAQLHLRSPRVFLQPDDNGMNIAGICPVQPSHSRTALHTSVLDQ